VPAKKSPLTNKHVVLPQNPGKNVNNKPQNGKGHNYAAQKQSNFTSKNSNLNGNNQKQLLKPIKLSKVNYSPSMLKLISQNRAEKESQLALGSYSSDQISQYINDIIKKSVKFVLSCDERDNQKSNGYEHKQLEPILLTESASEHIVQESSFINYEISNADKSKSRFKDDYKNNQAYHVEYYEKPSKSNLNGYDDYGGEHFLPKLNYVQSGSQEVQFEECNESERRISVDCENQEALVDTNIKSKREDISQVKITNICLEGINPASNQAKLNLSLTGKNCQHTFFRQDLKLEKPKTNRKIHSLINFKHENPQKLALVKSCPSVVCTTTNFQRPKIVVKNDSYMNVSEISCNSAVEDKENEGEVFIFTSKLHCEIKFPK
jgi:hypothetical protein